MNPIAIAAEGPRAMNGATYPHALIRVFLTALLLFVSRAGLPSEYEWLVDPDEPGTGVLRLTLEAPLKEDTIFVTRQMQPARAELSPHCDNLNEELEPTGQGWKVPAGCSAISWSVSFRIVESPTINVAQQINLHYPDRWWLLTEWGSLLRPDSQEMKANICAQWGRSSTCRSLPEWNQPPLFLLAGEPDDTHRFGDITFRFFQALLPTGFSLVVLRDRLEQQATYLTSLVPGGENPDAVPSAIDVLILGINESLEGVGGAAGHAAYLANVAVDDGNISSTQLIRTLWITGHEMFHLLSLDSAPLWAAESLAHYYGYKSTMPSETAERMFDAMLEDLPDMGLLQAQRLVTQQGQNQRYGLFYSRGAAFWRSLDQKISESTGGESDLDAFLPMLRDEDFGPDGSLPPTFVDAIGDRIGAANLDRLLREYL